MTGLKVPWWRASKLSFSVPYSPFPPCSSPTQLGLSFGPTIHCLIQRFNPIVSHSSSTLVASCAILFAPQPFPTPIASYSPPHHPLPLNHTHPLIVSYSSPNPRSLYSCPTLFCLVFTPVATLSTHCVLHLPLPHGLIASYPTHPPKAIHQKELAVVEARQQHVRSVLEAAAPDLSPDTLSNPSADEHGASRFVSAAWLGAWAGERPDPPPVDNGPLLCEHGKLDLRKVQGRFSTRCPLAVRTSACRTLALLFPICHAFCYALC